MKTFDRIRKQVGCPVHDLQVKHAGTDPHFWTVQFIFDYYTVPTIVAGLGDTRAGAIDDAIRCAEQRKH
jgi:hypothetical protein